MKKTSSLAFLLLAGIYSAVAATPIRYYAHDAVLDRFGVIAPWYQQLNGQCDFRVRIAAETLKRYPWTSTNHAVAAYPDYLFTSLWQISSNGTITPKNPGDWMNGDLGQRSTSVLLGLIEYYRYSGDPAAIAHLAYMGNYLLDQALTPRDHPWPEFPISVPLRGKAYGHADPKGLIQLDICASMGLGLLRAYQVTGTRRWLEAAKHWGDLFAKNCNVTPGAAPWPRYANPENCPWPGVNEQTGGVTMIIRFLDELIRLGYAGHAQEIVAARDAGVRYLHDQLLPAWTADKTWGQFFWDWPNPTHNCSITADVVGFLVTRKERFPNWRSEARNILLAFLNRSSANPDSGGDVYSGAWAYPESSSCCGRSLWYAPLMDGAIWALYAVEAADPWAREIACRQLVLQTYDIHETGLSEDNIDGGIIVNGNWLNIAHPWPLLWVLTAIGWLPEELGPSRENHLVRSSAVVTSIIYDKGHVSYRTFDAPPQTIGVLRLSFSPKTITADGVPLRKRTNLEANGYLLKALPNGDAIVTVRHDGCRRISLTGQDPQQVLGDSTLAYEGNWEVRSAAGASAGRLHASNSSNAVMIARFTGNQVRLIGRADPFGGLADVFLDGEKQLVHIDCWNPSPRDRQVLYYRNGLNQGAHALRVVPRGTSNPYSQGAFVYIDGVQFSAATGKHHFPSGSGPTGPQRMIFGYPHRIDYRDSKKQLWRPAGEIVHRAGPNVDTIASGWWTNAADTVTGAADPELYKYGYHARDFWVNLTVAPGNYDLRLLFANTRGLDTHQQCFDLLINGERVVHKLDVTATAGGRNRGVDLLFPKVSPRDGIIQVRFAGVLTDQSGSTKRCEAFVQALEIAPRLKTKGAVPVASTLDLPANLLLNPGFEETIAGTVLGPGKRHPRNEWTYVFAGATNSYVFQERDYSKHPEWGLPEFHSGAGAIRTHSDGDGLTTIFQDVEVEPETEYIASVWVRAVDLHGKGFGQNSSDSAGLILSEMTGYNRVLRVSPKAGIKAAGPYIQLSRSIRTGPDTRKLRFSLDTTIKCHYTEGHVTYDDCVLLKQEGLSNSR